MKDTPIFILSYNRPQLLRQCVGQWKKRGYHNIVVIDSNSFHPELLDYYRTNPDKIFVHRMHKNWSQRFLKWSICNSEYTHVPYNHDEDWFSERGPAGAKNNWCVTSSNDSILVDDCPDDVLFRMRDVVQKYGLDCCSVELLTNDIPRHYPFKKTVDCFESHYKRSWLEPGVANCFTDFTVNLHRPFLDRAETLKAARLSLPYAARNAGWYINPDAMSSEEKFYLRTMACRSSGYASALCRPFHCADFSFPFGSPTGIIIPYGSVDQDTAGSLLGLANQLQSNRFDIRVYIVTDRDGDVGRVGNDLRVTVVRQTSLPLSRASLINTGVKRAFNDGCNSFVCVWPSSRIHPGSLDALIQSGLSGNGTDFVSGSRAGGAPDLPADFAFAFFGMGTIGRCGWLDEYYQRAMWEDADYFVRMMWSMVDTRVAPGATFEAEDVRFDQMTTTQHSDWEHCRRRYIAKWNVPKIQYTFADVIGLCIWHPWGNYHNPVTFWEKP